VTGAAVADAAPIVLLPPAMPLVAPPRQAVLHRLAGRSMGTGWQLAFVAPQSMPLAGVSARVQRVLDELERQMSHWREDSELGHFNRLPPGDWFALSPDFDAVMRLACEIAEASDGAFDPTLGESIERWGFGPLGRHDSPGFQPDERPATVGVWRALRHDSAGRWQQPGGCSIDLSAIAKGHAVDAVVAALRADGHHHLLFELGGELLGEGLKPDGQPWWVAVERPPGAAALPALRVALAGQAVATSGNYRQGYAGADGRWLSHTIDPRTGRPVGHGLASVSVLDPSCARADALATALFVMGPYEGPRWASRHDIAAWFVARDVLGWRECASPALAGWMADA
jgi:FAD:protein FMN transferase